MRPYVRYMQFAFGLRVLMLVGTLLSLLQLVQSWQRFGPGLRQTYATYFVLTTIRLAGASLLDGFGAVAWWTIRTRKPSARLWALWASLCYLISGVMGLVNHRPNVYVFDLFDLVLGVCGLLVFARALPKTEGVSTPAALEGDGTSRWIDYAAFAGVCLALYASWLGWRMWSMEHGRSWPSPVAIVGYYAIARFAATVIHECGHIVAGWASAMKLHSIQIGPAVARIRSGRWQYRWLNHGYAGGGAVGLIPLHLGDLKNRRIRICLGGPVASLLLAIAAFTITLQSAYSTGWALWAILCTIAAIDFVFNLVPARPTSLYSDGALLVQLLRGGAFAQQQYAFAAITHTLVSPSRPGQLDTAELEATLASCGDLSRRAALHSSLCQAYAEQAEMERAKPHASACEALFDQCEVRMRPLLAPSLVFWLAFYLHDLKAAEKRWETLEKDPEVAREADYYCALTALQWLRGDLVAARSAWGTGHALAQRLPAAGAYEHTRWCFTQLAEAMSQPAPLPTTAAQAAHS